MGKGGEQRTVTFVIGLLALYDILNYVHIFTLINKNIMSTLSLDLLSLDIYLSSIKIHEEFVFLTYLLASVLIKLYIHIQYFFIMTI